MTHLLTLPEAFAHMEGFGLAPFNRPTRNNNPGDLEFEPWMKLAPYNATLERVQPGVKARFAKFPTADIGWIALKALLLSARYRSLTIRQAVTEFAPPVENDTEAYIATVCKQVGCAETDTVLKVMTTSL